MSPDNALAELPVVKLDDLRGKVIAARSHPSYFPYHAMLRELSCKMIFLGDETIVFNAVIDGHAIALLPMSLAQKNTHVEAQRLVCKNIEDVNFPFYHYLLSPLDRILTTDERILYNYLKLHYNELIS
jgi:hypothetical protein